MEIKVLESVKNRLKIELVGKHHTLPNLISKELWNDKDIAVAGYTLEHPIVSNAMMIIETKGSDPKKALLKAISRLSKKNKDFLAAVKKSVK
ncbi:MAG: DNA-directed RNA polymerase subunit L [Candidatus Woesearchaeota archaeon]